MIDRSAGIEDASARAHDGSADVYATYVARREASCRDGDPFGILPEGHRFPRFILLGLSRP